MTNDRPLPWRTSSYTGDASGNCVEIALTSESAHLRDTKYRTGGTHIYTRPAWTALLTRLRAE